MCIRDSINILTTSHFVNCRLHYRAYKCYVGYARVFDRLFNLIKILEIHVYADRNLDQFERALVNAFRNVFLVDVFVR